MTNARKTDEIKVKVAAPTLAPSLGVLVVLVSLVLLITGASGM